MAIATRRGPVETATTGPRNRFSLTRQEKTAIVFILPLMIPLTLYWIIPSLASLYFSMTNYSVVMETKWIGLANFSRMLDDGLFWRSIKNTLLYTVGYIPLVIIFGLILALAVNAGIRGRSFFRVVFYLPVVTSTIALSMVWLWLYDPNFGLLNAFLKAVGLPPLLWLQSTKLAIPSIIIMSVWMGVGGAMIIFLAGLQGVPESLYEAARVDGASRWQLTINITLPILKPVTLYVLITSIIASFQIFGPIYAMTDGGPAFATTTIVHQIYVNGFRYFNMGYASAQSWVLFLLLLGLSVFNMRLMRSGMEI